MILGTFLGVCILILGSYLIYLIYNVYKFKVFYNNIKHRRVTYYWVENDYPVKIRDFQILRDYSQIWTSNGNILRINDDVFVWFRKNSHKILPESKAKEKYPEWLI